MFQSRHKNITHIARSCHKENHSKSKRSNTNTTLEHQRSNTGTSTDITHSLLVGDWTLASIPEALCVGDTAGSCKWFANNADDLTERDCLFDDIFRFNSDGSFENILQDLTWLDFQDIYYSNCSAPESPFDNSGNFEWAVDFDTNEVVLTGRGSYLGLPKVTHSGELAHPSDALDSVRYKIARAAKYDCPSTGEGKSMTLQVNYATDAWWQFVFRGGDCVVGCMTSTANNYDSNAVIDDGSCVYSGCTLFVCSSAKRELSFHYIRVCIRVCISSMNFDQYERVNFDQYERVNFDQYERVTI